MLNGNGALDTSTHRLLHRVRDEIATRRLDPLRTSASEAPTEELQPGSPPPSPPAQPAPGPFDRYPQV
jgi:hypothetical protein